MKVDIKYPEVGPVLKAKSLDVEEDHITLIIEETKFKPISGDTNDTATKAFLFIVQKFLDKNEISFKVGDSFDCSVMNDRNATYKLDLDIHYTIPGHQIDPMEYFINGLEESKK